MKKWSKRLVALLLLAATALPMLSACNKNKPNDDDDEGEISMDYYLKLELLETIREPIFDFSDPAMMSENAGIMKKISEDIFYESEEYSDSASLSLTKNDGGLHVVEPLITDWSDYTHLSFAIYSEKATNTTFQLRFNNPSDGSTMAPYVRVSIMNDWEGWKTFSIDIASMPGNYDPTITNLIGMHFDTSGWNLDCSDEISLRLGTIYGIKANYNVYCDDPEGMSDPTLFSKPLDQWRELLVGDPDEKAKHSDEYKAKVESVSKSAQSSWSLYQSQGGGFGLNITNTTTTVNGDEQKIGSVYGYILKMAQGYATVGTEMYHNKRLLNDIKTALEYAYDNYYGTNVLNDQTYGNWWWWDIGTPMYLVNILVILENELGEDLVEKYLEPFDYRNQYPSMTACNKVWIAYSCYASALLQKDAERMMISKQFMNDVFDYVGASDGFYTDGSFLQHEKHPYTGGYGLSMMVTLSDLMTIMHRTRFDFYEDNVRNQYTWMLESFAPVNYESKFFASVRGREVDRNTSETAANNSIVAVMIKMANYAPADLQPRIEQLLRYNMIARNSNYSSVAPLMYADYAVALKDNNDITTVGYQGSKVFGMMDRVTQHGPEYGVCVALNSTRIYRYEAINSENMDAWYHSDGMIYIYTDGYDYSYDFFNYVNPYRIPGTTVSTVERKVENIGTPLLNSSAFSGGVEAGSNAIAVYQLAYGENKHYTSALKANKTYFMFDNEIVAVGSGITDKSGYDINTIIENRIWRDDDKLYIDGQAVSALKGVEKNINAKSLHFSNMGGYVFFDTTALTYSRSSKSVSFFELWMNHGKNLTNAQYSYVYLPEATVEETTAYSANPDVVILTQTNTIHVVKETKLNTTGYAFYDKGSANGVTTNAACVIMVSENNGEYTINISDPTHLLDTLKITLELPATSVVSKDDAATVAFDAGKVVIQLDIDGNIGQTYTVKVK